MKTEDASQLSQSPPARGSADGYYAKKQIECDRCGRVSEVIAWIANTIVIHGVTYEAEDIEAQFDLHAQAIARIALALGGMVASDPSAITTALLRRSERQMELIADWEKRGLTQAVKELRAAKLTGAEAPATSSDNQQICGNWE